MRFIDIYNWGKRSLMSEVRAQNAAKIKVNCVRALSKRLQSSAFDDIMVREICADAGISKVTFFKYFSCKEELLRYKYRIWSYELCIDITEKKITGKKGIHYIFSKLNKDLEALPAFFLAYISYRVKMERLPTPFPIRLEEKYILFPDIDPSNIDYKSIEQLIEGCVLDSIFKSEINSAESTEVSNLLITMLYGIMTKRGTAKRSLPAMSLKNSVEAILHYYK